ncbi:Protein CBR-PAR-4 [Caenorhabditis briggsae]|uniref:Serine/threonine-protein kinase par-4 n=1 Tax=Caenorhabditis briggsae TaxID=6238 RepID=PAR4_CAEBR|nr:Protein CBR-PAR-4 [Caenorhabditis briggsae]A8X0C4.2 RecName: Full=Serine/threonine-protein kinase par-4 [Caenorhabditis briggsae]CAP26084.2 Protein CBR-PAR-4 [Caenorhabditis briggsae]
MEGPSSSSVPTASDAPSKYLLPSDSDDGIATSSAANVGARNHVTNTEKMEKEKKPSPMVLNVDPDYDYDEEDGGSCEEDQRGPPAPISREIVDGAIARRSRDRQISPGVKMSIGNYDDMEDDDEEAETPEEQKQRFLASMKRIRNQPQEAFDPPEDTEAMREFINRQVNDAMMFNRDNHIDYSPVNKPKEAKIIEGYLWGGIIGTGSYGKVKEVIDIYTITRRAAKIMKYEKLRKIPNGWDNIRSEMSILRRLNHRNIVKLIEVFNLPEKGKVYMIFEYCIGSVQNLIDMEPAHRLSIGESHAIFLELCHGLNYLHSKRVSHKDIKPGNLLLSIDMTVKICDFGVAEQICLFQSDGRCTKVNGTPKFQPPECVYGNHEYFDGYKVDMWSAGVTLYNMVSGKYPFEQQVLLRLYESIGTNPVEMPTNVELSKDLQDIIKRLLDKDFNTRPNISDVMQHPWFQTGFPEDQGLGRIMERMRTGDRPFTMYPSLQAMYDGAGSEVILDEDGNELVLPPPDLVKRGLKFFLELKILENLPGTLSLSSFPGFQTLEKRPGDGPPPSSDSGVVAAPDSASGDPLRRPSSRSMPTSAPPRPPSGAVEVVEAVAAPEAVVEDPVVEEAPAQQQEAPDRRRRGKRSLFSCIFRSRTDSS